MVYNGLKGITLELDGLKGIDLEPDGLKGIDHYKAHTHIPSNVCVQTSRSGEHVCTSCAY